MGVPLSASPAERLTALERDRLGDLERVVDAGLQTFVDVGLALQEIRDGRLYRETAGTFEAYLADRWSIKRAHGYRLIDAARVAEVVSPVGDIPNERQARELAPLLKEPELLQEAWSEVVGDVDPPTAGRIRDVVRRLVVPVDDEVIERQQRQTLINELDRAIRALELTPAHARAEARRLLRSDEPHPLTPDRLDRAATYAAAFAAELRRTDGQG